MSALHCALSVDGTVRTLASGVCIGVQSHHLVRGYFKMNETKALQRRRHWQLARFSEVYNEINACGMH